MTMRILHTSDWHIGRTFHKEPAFAALGVVFGSLEKLVTEHKVDVVIAAGDIFDSSTPSADAVTLLDTVLLRLSEAGARVVLTSGNHDSPARLGAKAAFAHKSGIHVLTEPTKLEDPVLIPDEHGDVAFYGLPFLEPAFQRNVWKDVGPLRSQRDALGHALGLVREDWAKRGGRAVVIAHTFVQGAEGDSCDSERDIIGGVDKVPVDYFTDFTYAALGHIHGRAKLAENVRYSGAPLHYSFSEADKPRGGWLVDLGPEGVTQIDWLDLPVPRPLSRISGTLAELLTDDAHVALETHWISATVTDDVRPTGAMRRLQARFKYAVELTFAPSNLHDAGNATYAERIVGKTDLEVVDTFLTSVRNGHGSSEEEADLMRAVIGTGSIV
jgi:DNA repair protein SbcD/Mre11